MIDVSVLGKGKDYIELKMSFVIFICTFDPFPGNDRKTYTFANRCREKEGLELGDETVKIFLNTKGTVGEVNEDIDKFLARCRDRVGNHQSVRCSSCITGG